MSVLPQPPPIPLLRLLKGSKCTNFLSPNHQGKIHLPLISFSTVAAERLLHSDGNDFCCYRPELNWEPRHLHAHNLLTIPLTIYFLTKHTFEIAHSTNQNSCCEGWPLPHSSSWTFLVYCLCSVQPILESFLRGKDHI